MVWFPALLKAGLSGGCLTSQPSGGGDGEASESVLRWRGGWVIKRILFENVPILAAIRTNTIILGILKILYFLGVLGQEGRGACVQDRGQLAGVSSLSTIRRGTYFHPVSQFPGPNLQHSYLNERALASRIN